MPRLFLARSGAPSVRRSALPLALLSMAAVLVAAGTSTVALPAFASAVGRAEFDAASQHLDLAADATPSAVPPRDAVTTTQLTPVQWPIDPASAVSSPFGPRIAPCAGCSTSHSGADLVPGEGTPVAAIADGTVVEAGFFGELGEHLMIRNDVDGATVTSVYGHLVAGSMPLAVGDRVARGAIVGRVGSTGESTGPHLHLGVLDAGGAPEDPIGWLSAHATQPWPAG